jgi:pilus assembly protein Flp/PilA
VSHIAVVSLERLRRAARVARKSESGATLVEYGLLLAAVALVVVVVLTALGSNVRNAYGKAAAAVTAPSGGGSGNNGQGTGYGGGNGGGNGQGATNGNAGCSPTCP